MEDATGERPHVVVIAGPNGAGKTTAAASLLPDLGVSDFVNADVLARGLSQFRPESVALQAGRIMLDRLHQLAAARQTFAFETTLASRAFAPWIAGLRSAGYAFDLLYLWVPSPEMSVSRVAQRVQAGGHHVPEDTVRRRYHRGLHNLFRLYMPLATHWRVLDSSAEPGYPIIALGDESLGIMAQTPEIWDPLRRSYDREHLTPQND